MTAAPPATLAILSTAASLAAAPLLPGLIHRTRSMAAGRRGTPLLQGYADLAKLLRKGAVYSRTTTWLFQASPVVGLAAVTGALALVPMMGLPAPVAFEGDLILLVGLLALARFAMLLAALDTGSSFEGMGASREGAFSALVEPALVIGLATLGRGTGALSLSSLMGAPLEDAWGRMGPALAMVAVSFFVLLLAENARIPVDDPATHLELTMIHEVMILDHSGPDLAFLEYAAWLKLWLFAALLAGLTIPRTGSLPLDAALFTAGMAALAVLVGVVESTMARLQMGRVPQLLLGASVLSAFSLVLTLR
jgi:formate hydrogenlyase subunit 4